MKSRSELSEKVLVEISTQCSVDPARDLQRLRARVKQEGESFLTITLPDFCASLERALDRGRIDQNDFAGFRRCGRLGPPRFLGGFLSKLFDATGSLVNRPPADVVFVLRQFLLLHKKSLATASERRQVKAIRGYLTAESEITDELNDPSGYYRLVAEVVVRDIFCGGEGFNPDSIVGRHGPGATSEGYTANKRWTFNSWHERLERLFSYSTHAVHNASAMFEREVQSRDGLIPENDESPVKVVFVPKTMKTPRVIAIEPSCMQYIQQGLLRFLVPRIERGSKITRGRINFSDQKINQRLARKASITRRLATLDMKEASDRVSYAHAKALFSCVPEFWDAVEACRSRRARLPDGTEVTLKKFASMGSALCFPVEALAFFCAIVASRLQRRGLSVTRESVLKYSRLVYVYGDDLIVPANEAEPICEDLKTFGFKVNNHKSFWTGSFRESCGVDAFDGVDVTPTYCRYAPPGRTDSEALVSWVAMANGFYAKGLWQTARAVRDFVEKLLGRLPVTSSEIGGLAWKTYSKFSTPGKWDESLHLQKVKTWVPKPVRRGDSLEGSPYAALFKCLSVLERGSVEDDLLWSSRLFPSPSDDEHLTHTVRRHALALKRGWVPIS